MEYLARYLSYVRTPSKSDVIYKDECAFCYETPDSPNGLFVCMNSFCGVDEVHIDEMFKKTGNGIFLNIRRTRKEKSSPATSELDEPTKRKHTKLAIGTEGGFLTSDYETHYDYSIFVYPDCMHVTYPDKMLPSVVCTTADMIVEAPSVQAQLEGTDGKSQWDGGKREESKFSENLLQLDNGKQILPTGWKCEKCDLRTNLWLNLTDGSILCGRKFYDGSGGNNHALEHYQETKYPLAVKLGTITPDGADVYSYAEDDMVKDSKLSSHLAHWGINMMSMRKSEKSMIELEIDLNEKFNDWRAIVESDEALVPVYGPGYTPMVNIGSSCYLNAVVQVIFDIPDFQSAFFRNYSQICTKLVQSPAEDLEIQTAKLAYGLLSGMYSKAQWTDTNPSTLPPNTRGIKPWMFKNAIGKGHPEFSTKGQQDAAEFFLYFLSCMQKVSLNHSLDPTECFRFETEERMHFSLSNQTRYTQKEDYLISLPIPVDLAENKEEYCDYLDLLTKTKSSGGDVSKIDPVRLKVSFDDCLKQFQLEEKIEDYVTSNGAHDIVYKRLRLRTFPDYLVFVVKRYGMNADWTPFKLDVLIDVPDSIDLSFLQSTGPQPGENIISDDDDIPMELLDKLHSLGFSLVACKKALKEHKDEKEAVEWLLEHSNDADIDQTPIPPDSGNIPSEMIDTLVGMGFSESQARRGLTMTENSVERAIDWLFSHPEETFPTRAPAKFRNGQPIYTLHAFISHIGLQVTSGHYVCHILKKGRWVIFNDERVALSEKPPKQLAYMYIYKRNDC